MRTASARCHRPAVRPAAAVIDRVEATSAIFDEFATAEQIDIAALRGGSAVKLSASATDLLEQP